MIPLAGELAKGISREGCFCHAQPVACPGGQQLDPALHHPLIEIEFVVMVRRRQIGPQDEVSRFAPLLLHPLHQKTGIFAGAKAASLDGGESLLAGQCRQL